MKSLIPAVAFTAALAGGAGALAFGPSLAGAQTPSSSTSTTAPAVSSPSQGNEDPTHEAAESTERESEEKAGHGFGDGGHSNTDAAHEANESPERAAEEAAHDAALGTPNP
jgi:hypothetical protein